MGRPINNRYLGDMQGSIKVSYYRRLGEDEMAGTDSTHIERQRTNNKFTIADSTGNWEENLRLVDKEPGNLKEGEFIIEAHDLYGIPERVTRLYNRSVKLSGNEKQQWSNNDPDVVNGIENVVLSGTNVAITTVGDHRLSTGDLVTFTNIAGTTELNGQEYTVTSTGDKTFTLDGTTPSNFSAYVSGEGTATRAERASGFNDIELTVGSPVRIITTSAHSFINGEILSFSDISGTTELNGNSYTITVDSPTSFVLNGTMYNGSNFGTFIPGTGEVYTTALSRTISDISLTGTNVEVTTSSSHGFNTGDSVTFSALPSTTELEGNTYTITRTSTTTFTLDDTDPSTFSAYVQKFAQLVRVAVNVDIGYVDLNDDSGKVVIYSQGDHDLHDGQVVTVTGVAGTTELNGNDYTVDRLNIRSFALEGTDATTGFSEFDNIGYVIPVGNTTNVDVNSVTLDGTNAVLVTTAADHGLSTGDYVTLSNISGTTELNGNTYRITVPASSTDTFTLDGTDSSNFSEYDRSLGSLYGIESGKTVHASAGDNRIASLSFNNGTITVTMRTDDTHPYSTGDLVWIGNFTDASATFLNDQISTVTSVTTTTFTLDDITAPDSNTAFGVTAGSMAGISFATDIVSMYIEPTSEGSSDYRLNVIPATPLSHSGGRIFYFLDLPTALDDVLRSNYTLDANADGVLVEDNDDYIDQAAFNTAYASVEPSDSAELIDGSNKFYITFTNLNDDSSGVAYLQNGEDPAAAVCIDVAGIHNITDGQEVIFNDLSVTGETIAGVFQDGLGTLLNGVRIAVNIDPAHPYGLTLPLMANGVDYSALTISYSHVLILPDGTAYFPSATATVNEVDNSVDPAIITTSATHGLNTGDNVLFDSEVGGGADEIHDHEFRITKLSDTTVSLVEAPSSISDYTPAGMTERPGNRVSIRHVELSGSEPVEISTVERHGFGTGDSVNFVNVEGTTVLNENFYTITVVDSHTFTLDGTFSNNSSYDPYIGGGAVVSDEFVSDIKNIETNSGTEVVVTFDESHSDIVTGNTLSFENVGGTTELNGNSYEVTVIDADTVSLNLTDGTDFSPYTRRGTATKKGTTSGVASLDIQDS